MNRIGILTIADISDYNPERLSFTIGSFLSDHYAVDLIGTEVCSKRIRDTFQIFTACRKKRYPRAIRNLLQIPFGLINATLYVRHYRPSVLMCLGNVEVNGLVTVLVSRLFSLPGLIRVTSDYFNVFRYQDTFPQTVRKFLLHNILGNLAIRTAQHIIVLGPVMEAKLICRGIHKHKLHVIPQPLMISKPRTEIDITQRHKLPPKSKRVLYVGRFTREKGFDLLAETIKYVHSSSQTIVFILAGGIREDFRVLRSGLATIGGVFFAGVLEHQETASYYMQCDWLLNTSNTEGLPNVVLEALYFSTPVVATDSGGEVVHYVSNIGSTAQELGDYFLTDSAKPDPLPSFMLQQNSRKQYCTLVESVRAK